MDTFYVIIYVSLKVFILELIVFLKQQKFFFFSHDFTKT